MSKKHNRVKSNHMVGNIVSYDSPDRRNSFHLELEVLDVHELTTVAQVIRISADDIVVGNYILQIGNKVVFPSQWVNMRTEIVAQKMQKKGKKAFAKVEQQVFTLTPSRERDVPARVKDSLIETIVTLFGSIVDNAEELIGLCLSQRLPALIPVSER